MSCSHLPAHLLCTLLAVTLLAASGCNSGPKVYPVKGQVVNKGKGQAKDLAGYSVQFQSVDDPEQKPGGPIEEDGSFILYTRVENNVVPGVQEGTYDAWLLPPAVEGGSPPPLVVPKRYMKLEMANLQFTIKPGLNEITLEIDRDK